MFRRQRLPLIICVFMLMCAVSAYAAITGVISGTVTDPTGAVVPKASVVVLNEATGVTSTATTDEKGFYTFPVLDVGNYTIRSTVSGFEKFEQKNIHIDANSSVRIDLALVVGNVNQTTEVISNRVQAETQSTQLGEVIDSEKITAVPLNGRSFLDLLSLQPGVSPQQNVESSDTPSPGGSGGVGSISVNGGRGASNGFMINGGNTNDGVENGAAVVPNLDSIQEFRIITSNFDAEYGNYSGSQVNVVTKNGTNQWHGSGFYFFRNTDLDAAPYTFSLTPLATPTLQLNIFGGTVGGPIRHDKIFFFGDYQGTRNTSAATTRTSVPSTTDLAGNVQDWAPTLFNNPGAVQGPGWATVLSNRLGGQNVQDGESYFGNVTKTGTTDCTTVDPNSATGCVFPNFTIPKAAWDPASPALLKYVPAANGSTSTSTHLGNSAPAYQSGDLNNVTHDDKESARVDFNTRFGTLFGYYFLDNSTLTNPLGAGSYPGWGTATQLRSQQSNVGLTTTFKNNSVNNFRFTYLRSAEHLGNPTFTVGSSAPSLASLGFVTPWDPVGGASKGGISNIYGPLAGVPTMSIGEAGSFGTPQETQGRFVNSFQWLDNYMKVIGTHTYQFGVDYSYKQINERNYYAVNGQFSFSDANETGLGYADFLLGAEDGGFTQASPQILDSRANYVSAYAEDAWRARKDLSINYGMRWEVTSPWYDTQNKLETIIPGEQSKVFPGAPLGWVFPGDDGVPRTLGPIKYLKFAPRMGFAWAPSGAPNTLIGKVLGGPGQFSLRGGFGLFYNNFQNESGFVEIGDAPYGLFYEAPTATMLSSPYVDRSTQHVELGKFPFAFPPTNVSPSNPDNNVPWASYEPLSSSYAVSPTNTVPYVMNYMLGVQRGVGRNTVVTINYVGNEGRHLADYQEANPGNVALCLSLSTTGSVASGTSKCGPKGENNIFFPKAGGTVLGTRILPSHNGNIAFGANPYLQTRANSNYNSLQASVKHSSKYWDVLFSYTWGKSMDNASSLTDPINAYTPKLTYGLSSFDVAHYFVTSYNIHMPFDLLVDNHFLKQIIGGWSVSGISKFQTGTPIGFSDSEDYSLTGMGSASDTPWWIPGATGSLILNRNPRNRDPNALNQALPFFNAKLFESEKIHSTRLTGTSLGLIGVGGNARRRFLHGSGSENTDLALIRDFRIREKHIITFRMEAFNALNHANFGNPTGSATSANFGLVTGTSGSPRLMQFAVKYRF